jgi:Flp pilus assembly protein TadG
MSFKNRPAREASRNRRCRRGERGQALLEFALSAPILILILLVIALGADIFNAYLTVVNAGRDAARVGSSGGTDDVIRLTADSDMERLRGDFDGTSQVAISRDTLESSIRVEVCYDHPHLLPVPIISDVIDNPLAMCSATKMPVPAFAGASP